MNALETIERLSNRSIIFSKLKFCLVDKDKKPFRIDNSIARPNIVDDFVEFESLILNTNLQSYSSIGISIQASNVCAIDVDDCFERPNDITSADDRAKYILSLFMQDCYCEFSFSGKGLRILFRYPIIPDYSSRYYIKNQKHHIEFYQPNNSFRYVTLTGNTIADNKIDFYLQNDDKLFEFLDKYMQRQVSTNKVASVIETRTYDELMKLVRKAYLTQPKFQDLWFTNAPGSGKDESERDYHLVAYLFENITQDKVLLKQIFETSVFFKTKDFKHICKWKAQDFRYFNYLYSLMEKRLI